MQHSCGGTTIEHISTVERSTGGKKRGKILVLTISGFDRFQLFCFRFDEDVHHVELDYPRSMDTWRGIGYNIDSALQYKDGKRHIAIFFRKNFRSISGVSNISD